MRLRLYRPHKECNGFRANVDMLVRPYAASWWRLAASDEGRRMRHRNVRFWPQHLRPEAHGRQARGLVRLSTILQSLGLQNLD